MTNSPGETVAAIVGNSISDPDPGTLTGIAVIGTGGVVGNWQYSLNGGATWRAVGTAQRERGTVTSEQRSLCVLLPVRANTVLPRSPIARFGMNRSALRVAGPISRRRDRPAVRAAFSRGTATASIAISFVPVPAIAPHATFVLPAVLKNSSLLVDGTVASWLNGGVTDANPAVLLGIAVIGTSGNGGVVVGKL